MKNLIVVVALVISGAAQAKELPSPFWFTVSEKILAETQSFFHVEVKQTAKAPKKKLVVPKVKAPISCEQDEQQIVLPFPTFKRGSGLWMITE